MHFASAALAILACQPGLIANWAHSQEPQSQEPQSQERTSAGRPTTDPNAQAFRTLAQAAGLPQPRNHPFVQIQTGGYSQPLNGDAIPALAFGILLEDDGTQFRALNERFQEVVYRRTPKGTDKVRQIKYAPIDPQTMLRRHLREEPKWDGTLDLFYGWLADGIDKQQLAEELFARVVQTSKHRNAGNSFVTAAAMDFGLARYEDAVMSFATKERSDTERLAKLDRWLGAFPNHERFAETKALHTAQERAMTYTVAAEATAIERYIYELVTTAGGISTGGWPFIMPGDGGNRPADKLFMLGIEAVPALLAALEDDRPSCTVRYRRRGRHSEVLRVDRIATQILAAISGLSVTHVEPAKAKPLLEAWWQRVQDTDATRELIARTEQGDISAATRLLVVAPELVADAVAIALPNIDNRYRRSDMMVIAARGKGAATTKLLRKILASKDVLAVAAVAEPLLKEPKQRATVLRTFRIAWLKASAGSAEAQAIAPLLCKHGDAEDIKALHTNPAGLTGRELRLLRKPTDTPRPAAAYLRAQKDLLRFLLNDERELHGVFGRVLAPRRCDYAALELARRWPKQYAFAMKLLRADRNHALAILRQEPLVADASPSTAILQDLQTKLLAWDQENLASQRVRILQGITEPTTLTSLRDRRDKVFKTRRTELDRTCRRLASTVLTVGPESELAKLPVALATKFRALAGQPLDPGTLVSCVGELVSSPAKGISEHAFEVLRRGNGPGVIVNLRSTPGDGEVRKLPQHNAAVAYGRKIVMHSAGSGVRSAVKRGLLATFANKLQEALDAADEEPIEARIRLVQRL